MTGPGVDHPGPSPDELAAIVAAVEMAWPRPVIVVAVTAARASGPVAVLGPVVVQAQRRPAQPALGRSSS